MATPNAAATPRTIRAVVPPPGLKLPPGSILADDGNVYDQNGRLLGRVQMPKTAATAAPTPSIPSTPSSSSSAPTAGPPSVAAAPVTPVVGNRLPAGVNPLPSPRGVTLPPGAQLGSDGHVYAGGKVIGKIAMASPPSPLSGPMMSPSTSTPVRPSSSMDSLLSPSIPKSTSSSSLAPPSPSAAAALVVVSPSTPSRVDHNRNASDAIQLHLRTPSAVSALGIVSPSSASHARSPSSGLAPAAPTPTASDSHARTPSSGATNGPLPAGVTAATVPTGLRLPANATLGNDGNVYDNSSGKILGKVQLSAPTPMAASSTRAASTSSSLAAPTPATAPSSTSSGRHSRGNSIWNNGLRAFPPGDIRPVEPPSGVKLPAGAMLNHDGRVFSSEGNLLGHIKMPGQAAKDNEKKTVQAIAPPPGVKLPPGAILTSSGDVFDAKSGKLLGHVKLPKIPVPPPPGVTLPAGSICTADGNVWDATGAKLLGHVKMPNAKTPTAAASAIPAHTSVGPDGVTVFDTSTGKVVGTVQKKPKELRVVDGRKFGLKEGMFVGPGGHVYNIKGKQLGHMKGWDERKFKKFLPAPHEEPVRLQDAEFEGKDVLVRGQVVGTLDDQGNVTDITGKVLGRVSLDVIKQVDFAIEKEKKLPQPAEIITELVTIPNYHQAEDNIDMTTDKLESLGAKEEKFVKIEVKEDKDNETVEPNDGMTPQGFALDFYDRQRSQKPYVDVIPSRFSRPYLPRDFPAEEKVVSPDMFNRMCQGKVRHSGIKLLWVGHLHQVLSASHYRTLSKLISSMKSLVVVGLTNCNLQSLDLHLPNLLRLDVSGNRLAGNKQIIQLVSNLPNLQQLNLSDNPCCNSWRHTANLPPVKDDIWKTFLVLKDFEALNGKAISNAVRTAAYQRHENKRLRAVVPAAIWNHAINYVPQIATMTQWQPLLITTLNLSGQALSSAHLFAVSETLVSLSLANNQFKTLLGWGLEHCGRLQVLDVSGNQLVAPKECKILANIPSLLDVNLFGNPQLGEYRADVIYLTRTLKGTNRSPGLQRMDNKPITIEERMAAYIRVGGGREEEHERWRLLQIQAYGHTQLRTNKQFISRIRRMEYPAANLSWVDVGAFKGLSVLDLSNNNIEVVNGLQQLEFLRVLLLHGNKRLQQSQVMKTLHATKTLEHVSFWSQNGRAPMSHLRTILLALPDNPKLAVIDGQTVPINERVKVQRELYQLSAQDLHQYHVDLALTIACTPFEGRSYRHSALKPGVQYRPEEIKDLSGLCNMELPSNGLDLSAFINVERIDLSANELTDICSIGLDGLKKLKYLDVRRNKIKNSLNDVGALLNSVLPLQLFAIARNPCMKDATDREKLIGYIERMHEVSCELRVIDTPITIDERVAAWKRIGGDERASEQLRYKAALGLRAPKPDVIAPFMLLALDLDGMNLVSSVDLTLFPNLQRLKLSNNRLETLKGTGISKSPHLRVLDLRNNRLSDMKEIVVLCNRYLPKLEYLGLRGNVYSTDQYYGVFRRKFVGAVKSLRQLKMPLRYLDDELINGAEICNGWIAAEPSQRQEAEAIRFNLVLDRKLNGRDPASVYSLDLSNCDLSSANFAAFVRLRKLNLSGNKFNVKQLEQANLIELVHLSELQLHYNVLTSAEEFGDFIGRCRGIRILGCMNNPITKDGTLQERLRVLAAITIIGEPRLPLKELDGRIVTTEERVAAIRTTEPAGNQLQSEYVRTVLTLEELKCHHSISTKVDVSDRALVNLNPLRFYNVMEHLVLSNNKLTSLEGQGLQYPSKLHTLDIRNNKIASLENVLTACAEIDGLEHLWLINSTSDGRTAKLGEDLLRHVCEHLRGVRTVDGHPAPSEFQLNSTQREALIYLGLVAEVGINHLKDVDIANLSISAEHFFSVLAALAELRCVRTLRATGNGWNEGSRRLANYRQFVIYAMGEHLHSLDGERIHDAERLLAIRTIGQNRDDVLKVQKWVVVKERAMRKVKEKPLAQEKKKKKAVAETGPNWMDWKNANSSPEAAIAADKKAAIIAAAGNKAGLAVGIAVVGTGQVLQAVTGTILNKFEIIVNFIQIYGLVLVLDLKVPWPDIWLQLSVWVKFFTLDIDIYFDITIPYKTIIKFAAVMALPFISILLFVLLGLVGKRRLQWIESYIVKWRRTRLQWTVALLLLLGLSFLGGLLADWDTSTALLRSKSWPSGRSNGIFAIFAATSLTIALIWYLIVRSFRRRYISDTTPEKRQFFEWWLDNILWWRKIALFMTTIIFMPVTRVILEQFHCMCPLDESLEVQESVLAPSPTNSSMLDMSCQIYPFTDPLQECFPHAVNGQQIAGMLFGLAYIIGIPWFYYRLIRDGVHQMIDIQGYTDLAESTKHQVAALKEERKALKGDAGKKAIDTKIAKLEKDLSEFYFNKATSPLAKLPQTYLYSAYERKWRFWKLFQMFQKLLIIICTMFIPRAAFSTFRVVCGNFVIVFFAAFSIVTRPFSDRWEDYMEILSQVANSANILVALGLSSNTIAQAAADGILLVINGIAVCMFALSIVLSPFQYCRNVYSFRAAKELAQRQARNLARITSIDSPNILSSADLNAVGDAAKEVGQQSVEMASRVITLVPDHGELRRGISTVTHGAAYVVDNRSALAAGAYSGVASAAAYAADNHGDWASQAANGVVDVANNVSPSGVAAVATAAHHINDGAHIAANGVASAAVSVGAAIGVDGDDIKRAAVEVKDIGMEVKDEIVAGAGAAANAVDDIPIPAHLPTANEMKAAVEQAEAAAIAGLSFVADSDIINDGQEALHDIGAQAMMILDDAKEVAGSGFIALGDEFSEEAANEWVDRASSAVSSAAAAIGVAVNESKDMISSSGASSSAAGGASSMSSSASGYASQASNAVQSGLQTASDALHSAGVTLQSIDRDDVMRFNANLGTNISTGVSYAVNNAGEAKRMGMAGASYVAQQLPGVGDNIVNAYQSGAAAIGTGITSLASMDTSASKDQVSRLDQAQHVAVDALRTAAIGVHDGAAYVYDHRQEIAAGVSTGVRTAANVTSNVAGDAVNAARNVDLGATGNAIASGASSAASSVAAVASDVVSRVDTDDLRRAAATGVNAARSVGAAGIAVAGEVDWRGAGVAVGTAVTTAASAASQVDLRSVGNAASSAVSTGASAISSVGNAGVDAIRDNVDLSGARAAVASGVSAVGDQAQSAVDFVHDHKQEIIIGGAVVTGAGAAFAAGGVAGVIVAGAAVLGSGVLGVGFEDIPGITSALSSGASAVSSVADGLGVAGDALSSVGSVAASQVDIVVAGGSRAAAAVTAAGQPVISAASSLTPPPLPTSLPPLPPGFVRNAAGVVVSVGSTVATGVATVVTSDNARAVASAAQSGAGYVYDHRDDIASGAQTVGNAGIAAGQAGAGYVYDHRADIASAAQSVGNAGLAAGQAGATYVYDNRANIASAGAQVGSAAASLGAQAGVAATNEIKDGAAYVYDNRANIASGIQSGAVSAGSAIGSAASDAATSAYDNRGEIGSSIASGARVAGNEAIIAATAAGNKAVSGIQSLYSNNNYDGSANPNMGGFSSSMSSAASAVASSMSSTASSMASSVSGSASSAADALNNKALDAYDQRGVLVSGAINVSQSGGSAALDAGRQIMNSERKTQIATAANDAAKLASAATNDASNTVDDQAQYSFAALSSGAVVAANAIVSGAATFGVSADSAFNNRDNIMAARDATDQHGMRVANAAQQKRQAVLHESKVNQAHNKDNNNNNGEDTQ